MSTTSDQVVAKKPKTSLLSLPGEVRNQIYEYALTGRNRTVLVNCETSGLFLSDSLATSRPKELNQLKYVNKQLRWETHNLELRYNTVKFCPKRSRPIGNDTNSYFVEWFMQKLRLHQRPWVSIEIDSSFDISQTMVITEANSAALVRSPCNCKLCWAERDASLSNVMLALGYLGRPSARAPKKRRRQNPSKPCQRWSEESGEPEQSFQLPFLVSLCKANPQMKVRLSFKEWQIHPASLPAYWTMQDGLSVCIAFADDDSLTNVVAFNDGSDHIARTQRKTLGFDKLFRGVENLTIFPAFDRYAAEAVMRKWVDGHDEWKEHVLQWAEKGIKPA